MTDIQTLTGQMDEEGKVPNTEEIRALFSKYGVQVLYGSDYPYRTAHREDNNV